MPPKKRGTRATKRKAEPTEEETVASPEQAEEAVEEESAEGSDAEGSGGEEAAVASGGEEETSAPMEQTEQEEAAEDDDSQEPPVKKTKVQEEEIGEKEKTPEPEKSEEELEKERLEAEEAARIAKEKAEAAAKAAKEEAERKAKIAKEEKAKEELQKELDKYWKAVKDDPADFTGWTYLLQFVDSKNLLEEGRKAYDAFLNRYPYCYGYWKKYSDLEKRNGTPEKVQQVFNRGTKAIPLSVDLWLHYINYVKSLDKENKDEYVREVYEKSLKSCGMEFRSDKLWDSYIKYEIEKKNLAGVYQIYQKCLKMPTMGVVENFDKFREFIKSNHPKDLMDSSEFLTFRKQILDTMKEEMAEGKDEEMPEAEEASNTEEKEEAAPGAVDDFEGSEKEITAMKEHLIFTMKKVFKETEKVFNARVKFESKIKRPYFHVKPLERAALVTWNEYIDYMKKSIPDEAPKGFKKEISVTEEHLEIIYERCLIACALYEEFWLGYINWMETREGDHVDKIRDLYSRACTSHLQNKINIHLRWAMFEEINKNLAKASEVLENLERAHPELTSVKLRRANLERRRGDDAKATHLFEACVESTQEEALNADCAIKFARYLRLHRQDNEKAKEVLSKAIELHSDNIKLYLQMLDLMIHTAPVDCREIVAFLDKAQEQSDFKASQKLLLSQRKLEFLEDFGTDIEELKGAQEEHVKLAKELKPKILEEEGSAPGQDQPPANQNHNKNPRQGKFGPPPRHQGPGSYPPVANTPSYGAQQNMAYQNNAGRYNTYPQGNYQQQYGQGYTGY